MLARILAATLVVSAAATAAQGQPVPQTAPRPQPPRGFPAEKFSTKPVQAGGGAADLSPAANDIDEQHKRRWEERSRDPAGVR